MIKKCLIIDMITNYDQPYNKLNIMTTKNIICKKIVMMAQLSEGWGESNLT